MLAPTAMAADVPTATGSHCQPDGTSTETTSVPDTMKAMTGARFFLRSSRSMSGIMLRRLPRPDGAAPRPWGAEPSAGRRWVDRAACRQAVVPAGRAFLRPRVDVLPATGHPAHTVQVTTCSSGTSTNNTWQTRTDDGVGLNTGSCNDPGAGGMFPISAGFADFYGLGNQPLTEKQVDELPTDPNKL
jgi:hypothetical protein